MPGEAIGGFLIYSLINAFTPGPGNILALNTVTNCGWKRGRPLFLGIFAGYYAVQLICALFVCGIGRVLPRALAGMRYAGAAYILYLAIHIARSCPDAGGEAKEASFWKGFLLQFMNVKIYLFGITALTGYVTGYSTSLGVLVFFELVIATIGTLATTVWIGAGLAIQRFYLRHYRPINLLLALALAGSAGGLLLSR